MNNMEQIDELDDEIKELEKKLGLNMNKDRKKRYLDKIEREGLGIDFFSFLDGIEKEAKMDVKDY